MPHIRHDVSALTPLDRYLFHEGTHARLHTILGAHPMTVDGVAGTRFAVWAPNAESVGVIGSFNGWARGRHQLALRDTSGIWEGWIPGVGGGEFYKYHLTLPFGRGDLEKADPFAFASEMPPATASRVWELGYAWGDAEWMARRAERIALDAPVAIYELHAGSWRRHADGGFLGWVELAHQLVEYLRDLPFTHVELLPVMEHPFYGSWGYQTTGYFAPTARYGTPQDLMYFVDHLHRHGIGVILDWVPSHFPNDGHGLAWFDGTHLFEHADPREGFHPDWKSAVFNYGRHEVRSFLLSSANFWLDRYHADGIRVDAVASMLYRDYSRKEGEWIPNVFGGRENLEAISFLKQLNDSIYRHHPDVHTFAEESTSWPQVSRPVAQGGLGFGYKWDMGWMHDTLKYFEADPLWRAWEHDRLTFRQLYAWTESFVLPLSHDEVVHGKRSLLSKMPGDAWQRFAGLRALYGYMMAQPGKKLLFMGAELGQWTEWNHDAQLDWALRGWPSHDGLRRWLGDLLRLYRDEPAMHRHEANGGGFRWIDCTDRQASVLVMLRHADEPAPPVVIACNFTPVPRHGYRVGVPQAGPWRERLNSDAAHYWGSGLVNEGDLVPEPILWHGCTHSLALTLPPHGCVVLVPAPPPDAVPDA